MLGFSKKKKIRNKEFLSEDFFLDFMINRKDDESEGKKKRTSQEFSSMEVALARKNFVIILSVFGVVIVFFLLSCLYYQTFTYGNYSHMAERNRYLSSEIDAQRGIIYDREMSQIAFNSTGFDLMYRKNDKGSDTDFDREAMEIAKVFNKSPDEIRNVVKDKSEKLKNENEFIVIDNLEKDKTIILKTRTDNFKYFYVKKSKERQYADPIAFSHILGYYSKKSDSGGWGIESRYNEYLKEIPGIFNKERNAKGEMISEELLKPSQSGKNLVLNLDKGTQEKAAQVIRDIVEKYNAKSGTAIIADVNTGGIIAMVSWPTFDANALSKGLTSEEYEQMVKDNKLSFFNRAISGEYSLGSTVKPVLGLAGLQEGLIKPDDSLMCEGRIALPGGGYKNDWTAHGYTDLNKAMSESCDVYFYILGGGYGNKKGLGVQGMNKYYDLFGYGKSTGIDIDGEKKGFLPDPQWKRNKFNMGWFVGDDYNVSIGQGYFTATPIQLTMATAAIANGGKLMKPKLVKAVLDSQGNEIEKFEPEVVRTIPASNDNFTRIRTAMRETVLSPAGTARGLQLMPVSSAAKTGTAQTSKKEVYHNLITIFAPYEQPEVSITVIIESAPYEMNAANMAARQIMSYYFGERLKKKEEAKNDDKGDQAEQVIPEITKPDGAEPMPGEGGNLEEIIIPQRIEEEVRE
ncbi:MAG: penicillin-binding transpeptidase domain-containing protein [Candidatus Pacebacteria bacterium]|nr:penicillin-binding transpeptidase domain-containing protein [Candidatus Paceibacterota bacterium]